MRICGVSNSAYIWEKYKSIGTVLSRVDALCSDHLERSIQLTVLRTGCNQQRKANEKSVATSKR